MSLHRFARSFAPGAFVVVQLVGGTHPAYAFPQTPSPVAEKVDVVGIPSTPEEHLAMAEEYKKKAASYRKEVTYHQKMLEDYKKAATQGPAGKVPENPWITKMRKHCEGYMKDAEALAVDADKFAEFHRLRAAELQGK